MRTHDLDAPVRLGVVDRRLDLGNVRLVAGLDLEAGAEAEDDHLKTNGLHLVNRSLHTPRVRRRHCQVHEDRVLLARWRQQPLEPAHREPRPLLLRRIQHQLDGLEARKHAPFRPRLVRVEGHTEGVLLGGVRAPPVGFTAAERTHAVGGTRAGVVEPRMLNTGGP